MSSIPICNEYITELNKLLTKIKQAIILSTPINELISEFDELLTSFKMINIQERKFDNDIDQYEKEIKNIKNHIDITILNKNYNSKLNQQNTNRIEILKDARETLLSTEKVGTNILENLDTQNEQIVNCVNKTNKINKDMNHSSKLTTKMSSWYHGLFK